MNSKQQGDVGVAHAIYYYTLQGYAVSIPNTDNTRYDLIVDKDGHLYRVQVKTTFTQAKNGNYVCRLETRSTTAGVVSSRMITKDETDLVWITTKDRDGYEIPVELIIGQTVVTLSDKYEIFQMKW